MFWKGVKIFAAVLLALLAIGFASIQYTLWRHHVFEEPTYDTIAPELAAKDGRPYVLIFSKTNGFRHVDGIPVANGMFETFALEEGWQTVFTENAAIHNETDLGKFDLVIWNNVSGDVLTESQRAAFKAYVETGGKFLGVHATGGDPAYDWAWHPEDLIRAQFIGHPLLNQFQDAVIEVEAGEHPSTAHLPKRWSFHDEWYSFAENPRPRVNVLMSLDESTYNPSDYISDNSLAMGDDHPIAWWHKVEQGTVLYSAIGHLPETYEDPNYRQMLKESVKWLLGGTE